MTYHPLAETHDTGEAYWERLGILGSSTGMAPIISADTTIPSVDAYTNNQTIAITDSVLKYTLTGGNANREFSWSLGATYSKVLAVSYFQWGSTMDLQGLAISEDAYTGDQGNPNYMDNYIRFMAYSYGNEMRLQKRVGGSYTTYGTDTTIYPEIAAYSPAYALAVYAEVGDPGVQTGWIKFGSTSQWFQLFSGIEGDLTTGFQTVGVGVGYTGGNVGRMISPFYVWGAA